MAIEMIETHIQPQNTATPCPSVRVMYKVVDRPKGTAIIAKDLRGRTSTVRQAVIKTPGDQVSYSPRTLSMLRFRGSSAL